MVVYHGGTFGTVEVAADKLTMPGGTIILTLLRGGKVLQFDKVVLHRRRCRRVIILCFSSRRPSLSHKHTGEIRSCFRKFQ